MARITNLSEVIGPGRPFLVEVINGYASNWNGAITNASTNAGIDLSSATITCEVDFWMATLSGTTVTAFAQVDASLKRALTVTIDADQSANPGDFILAIPSDLWTEEISLDARELPMAVAYLKIVRGTETRVTRFVIAFRRGEATDG